MFSRNPTHTSMLSPVTHSGGHKYCPPTLRWTHPCQNKSTTGPYLGNTKEDCSEIEQKLPWHANKPSFLTDSSLDANIGQICNSRYLRKPSRPLGSTTQSLEISNFATKSAVHAQKQSFARQTEPIPRALNSRCALQTHYMALLFKIWPQHIHQARHTK